MANLVLTGGELEFRWQITGLSNTFDQAHYIRAGITRYQFTSSTGASSISGIVDEVSAQSSSTSTSTSSRWVDWNTAETRQFWGWTQVPNGTYWPAGTATVTISPVKPRVSKWSWTASNGSASTTQTRNAYSAVTGKGYTTEFSYLVWNDLVDKVNECANAFSSGWSTRYATLAATKMTSSDKRMTATRFNSLRYNIGRSYSTNIDEEKIQPGKIIYGSYFDTLAKCINGWIDRDS